MAARDRTILAIAPAQTSVFPPGMVRQNLITDVPGVRVGNAHDERLGSGVTAIVFDHPAVAAIHTPGGAPALRDTALLEPEMTVETVDAILLSGGSVFGLDAAAGAQAWLREQGRGFRVGGTAVPIVSQAACFDLLNGGNKEWERYPPYRELGYDACAAAAGRFGLGTAGGGYGATTVNLKGGLGSASAVTASGYRIGALVIANAVGSAVVGDGPHFWAAPWEEGREFGGIGFKARLIPTDLVPVWKGGPGRGTTIGLVATDAGLPPFQTKRLAIMAGAGLARSLRLTFAPLDGDAVFAASTGGAAGKLTPEHLTELGCAAADCLARAVARGVYEATAPAHETSVQSWRERFVGSAS